MPHGLTAHYFPERAEVPNSVPAIRPIDIGKARTLLLRRERALRELEKVDEDIKNAADQFGGMAQYEKLTGIVFGQSVEIGYEKTAEGNEQ